MKYYIIRNSSNKSVIGHYPQTKAVKYTCDVWDEPRFIEHTHFKKIDFEPIVANAILDPKSKRTDLIYIWDMGFSLKLLMSGKLKRLLEQSRNSGLQFFNAPIIHRGDVIDDYWIMNAYELDMNCIDMQKSNAIIRKSDPSIGFIDSPISFKSLDDFNAYIENKDREGRVQIDKIAIKSDCLEDFIVIRPGETNVCYIVSEKLKEKIEACCTGMEFQPSELRFSNWLHSEERKQIYGE